MRKTVTLLLAVCLLLACPMDALAAGDTQAAGSAVIKTEVPSTHLLTVEAEHAAVSYNGETGASFAVPRLESFTLTVTPAEGYAISGVTLNGEDVTALLSGTTLTLDGIYKEAVLSVATAEIPEEAAFSGVLYDLPEQDFPDNGLLYKVAVEVGGLTEVPEAFQSNPELNTVEKITQVLTTILIGQCGYPEENVAIYEVTLVVSDDNGATWAAAKEEHFPEGGLTVILPYPEGTGKDTHDFAATHMFTSTAFGKTPGETENPAVTGTDTGMQLTLNGLSPVAVAWYEIETETETSGMTETETETSDMTEIETETSDMTETETETSDMTETETETETSGMTETETETETSGMTETETETETSDMTETETSGMTETETETETSDMTETETSGMTETETETETSSMTETETETETSGMTETETETETSGMTETETETETSGMTETDTETETSGMTETDTETETSGTTETETETSGTTETETETSATTAAETTESPATGDNTNLLLWFTLMGASCGVILLAACLGKKKY